MSEQEVFDALKYRIEVDTCGTRWYHNSAGQLHRDDGPAVEYITGSKEWWQHGELHRVDGPAIEWCNGSVEWWLNGVQLTEVEFNQEVKQMSEQEVFDALKYRIEDTEYARCYYNSADHLHRTEGPAVIWADGTRYWYQNGLRHRTDGAAIVGSNGDKFWFINGRMMTEAEFNQAIDPSCNKC